MTKIVFLPLESAYKKSTNYYMDKFSFLNAAHTGFIADLYDQYLQNPDAVEPSWRSFFQGYDLANENYSLTEDNNEEGATISADIPEKVRKEFFVVDLINGYRTRGHLFTKTNPVRERRKYEPTLAIENFGLSQDDLEKTFSAGEVLGIRKSIPFRNHQTLKKDLLRIYWCGVHVHAKSGKTKVVAKSYDHKR